MKINKDGKVVLTGIDYQVGNFVFSNYAESVGFCDINKGIEVKISKRFLIGEMLQQAIEGKNENFLHNYSGVVYYLLGIVPDGEYLETAFKAASECMKRHPELYPHQEKISDEEDANIIREEKELSEFEDQVRKEEA